MNKIININLGGRLIPIDEDGYALLNRYLSELKGYFVEETGGPEILRDMEDRIAELFQEILKKGAASIRIEDVESVKQIMGSPEAIHDEAGNEETFEAGSQADPGMGRKRLSRSRNEKVISGVCGGLAAYFNMDPVVVRIIFAFITLFWGAGLMVYILLWILLPESEDRPATLKRRLYRDEDRKVLGGVCAGLAAYLKIDTIWLRLLFLLPLIFGGFISLFDSDWFSVSIGGLPGVFILYCILWAALPSARSVSEKLQMRGEKVDINSLSAAHKHQAASNPNRSNSFFRLVKALFKVFMILIIVACCIALLSVLAALFFGSLGMGVSLFAFPFHDLITDNETHQWILFVSLAVLIILPVYAFIRAMAYLISAKKKPHPKGLTIGLVLLFLISAGATVFVIGQIAQDFRVRYYTTEQLELQPVVSDTILISQQSGITREGEGVSHMWEDNNWDFGFLNDSLLMLENVSLNLQESSDSLLHLSIEKIAYGRQLDRARSLARAIDFDFSQNGATLIFPEAIGLSAQQPFRGQSVHVTLWVPKGKVIRFISGDTRKSTVEYSFRNGRFRVQHRDEHWEDDRYYQFRNGRLLYTDEPEGIDKKEGGWDEANREGDRDWEREVVDTHRKPPPPPAPGY